MAVKGNRDTSGGSRHSDWKQWKHLEGRRGRQGRQGKSVAGKISAAFADGVDDRRAIVNGRQREQGHQWRQ